MGHLIFKQTSADDSVYPKVFNKKREYLGQIGFHPQWKEHIFMPDKGTMFSAGCLREIADHLDDIKRREQQTKQTNRKK